MLKSKAVIAKFGFGPAEKAEIVHFWASPTYLRPPPPAPGQCCAARQKTGRDRLWGGGTEMRGGGYRTTQAYFYFQTETAFAKLSRATMTEKLLERAAAEKTTKSGLPSSLPPHTTTHTLAFASWRCAYADALPLNEQQKNENDSLGAGYVLKSK